MGSNSWPRAQNAATTTKPGQTIPCGHKVDIALPDHHPRHAWLFGSSVGAGFIIYQSRDSLFDGVHTWHYLKWTTQMETKHGPKPSKRVSRDQHFTSQIHCGRSQLPCYNGSRMEVDLWGRLKLTGNLLTKKCCSIWKQRNVPVHSSAVTELAQQHNLLTSQNRFAISKRYQ